MGEALPRRCGHFGVWLNGRAWAPLGLSSFLGACGAPAFPDGANNEYEANRTLARCEASAKPNTYYDIIPVDHIHLERPRDRVGLGVWGFSLGLPLRRSAPSRLGLGPGAHEQFSSSGDTLGTRQGFLLYTGEHPEEMPALRIHTRTQSGEVTAMARVNQCDLLHTKYVDFDGRADVQLEVKERERRDFTQTIHVPARAGRPTPSTACGGATGAGLLLLPGQEARVSDIDGKARFGTFHRDFYGPLGTPNRWLSYRHDDLGGINHGALVMKTNSSVAPARVGARIKAKEVTCVSFFINDTHPSNNKGAFEVTLDVEDDG